MRSIEKKMADDTSESAGQAETITEASSVRQVLLIQPSSVEADCVFYLLTCSFEASQESALQNYRYLANARIE